MKDYIPSYDEYRKILQRIKRSGKLMTYEQAAKADSFIILRHDVEFSLQKALRMAEVESECCINSTYFVQIESSAYNALSEESRDIISKIVALGHVIGLHYRQYNKDIANERLLSQVGILSGIAGQEIKLFSIHRPNPETEYEKIECNGVVNSYCEKFFTRTEAPETAEVKYISDSKFRWNYGYPDERTISESKKIQLLVHPFSWSETGESMIENLRSIITEKEETIKHVLKTEFSRWSEAKIDE